MTCKCYLLPGNADNQTVPGRKELILIFILGTDSDISPRIPAGNRREGHFPPVHTLGADFSTQPAQQSVLLVSCTSCETLECTKTQLSAAIADYVSTHVCQLDLKTDKLSQTVRTQQSL